MIVLIKSEIKYGIDAIILSKTSMKLSKKLFFNKIFQFQLAPDMENKHQSSTQSPHLQLIMIIV